MQAHNTYESLDQSNSSNRGHKANQALLLCLGCCPHCCLDCDFSVVTRLLKEHHFDLLKEKKRKNEVCTLRECA